MIEHIPPWVPALLALLCGLGFIQSRPRWVAPALVSGVGVGLAGYSLWGVMASFGAQSQALLPWVAGIAAAFALGPRGLTPTGMRYDPVSRRVYVPGSWLPLAAMLGIFGVRFALGWAAAVGAPILPGGDAAISCAGMLGLFSGILAERARAIVSVAVVGRRDARRVAA